MKIIVTGTAGFIGYSLSKKLLERGNEVIGIDNHNDYYDLEIKENRYKNLIKHKNYIHYRTDLVDNKSLREIFQKHKSNIVVNLAAQAGLRYSIENPLAYIQSNILGFANVLENCRNFNIENLIYASTSSVYGANTKMPFSEHHSTNHPLSVYSASKKSNELMSHSYSYLYGLPTTGLRFFTVYGPWGRPDMALFKFTKGILNNDKIDIYNNGKMHRDFTYVDDIVNGIFLLLKKIPNKRQIGKYKNDSLSHNAPFRVLNIGNSKKILLLDFINEIELRLKKKSKRKYMSLQKGDVKRTLSNISLIKSITKYKPKVNYKKGIQKFIKWYKIYYKVD